MSVAKAQQRISNLMAHGSVTAVNDGGSIQRMQLRVGYMEVRDNTRVLQQFGLASSPPLGSDALLLCFGGDRSNGLVVGTGHGSRPVGQAEGETTLFNAHGMTIALTAAGIVIIPNGMPVTIQGDLRVTGSVVAGFGSGDAVNVQTHRHGTGAAAAGTSAPTAGT